MRKHRVVLVGLGCAFFGLSDVGAKSKPHDAGDSHRGVAPPPPITVLPVFEWAVEEAVGTRTAKTELFVYSSGMAVLVLPARPLARFRARADDGQPVATTERLVRRQIPRKVLVGLLKTLDEARFRSFPEKFAAVTRDRDVRVVVRATLRGAERTIGVTCEPPGDDRTLRAAPASWAAIEKTVRSILALLKPKADEGDDAQR